MSHYIHVGKTYWLNWGVDGNAELGSLSSSALRKLKTSGLPIASSLTVRMTEESTWGSRASHAIWQQ